MVDLGEPNVTPFPAAPPPAEGERPPKPRLKKLRLLILLLPLGLLALVSTVFGMMMAVSSDLPNLENRAEYRTAKNTILTDARGQPLGVLANNQNRYLVSGNQIAPIMKDAIISVEDRRFYTNSGVDIKGIARAFINDVVGGGPRQGASTITQQFVKNALQAQAKRTVFEKLREAALAYHLTQRWSKDKILTEYLNSVYFGNGAYGIEAAARTYFGSDHPGCGTTTHPCAAVLRPWEAALLAGVVASPSGFDPTVHFAAARARRALVLKDMLQQHYIDRAIYAKSLTESLTGKVQPPSVQSKSPYFTTWVRQQLIDRYGARRALEGGLKVRTTLDLQLQTEAQQAVNNYLAYAGGPQAALVAIDNKTGQVRAMVGGRDYATTPFNLATQGQRQPGSSIKPFILAEAFKQGISPDSVWPSRKRIFTVPHTHGREHFVVNNFESTYEGERTLANALAFSDNTVFAAVGIHVGTTKIAALTRQMGIRTPVSTNYAMTLGGLREGVTPLDMAHAYESFATGGLRVSGTLGAENQGPVGIAQVTGPNGKVLDTDKVRRTRAIPQPVAQEATQVMRSVITEGTAKNADIGTFAAGKTGTTENYGDAWFIGYTNRLTVAVWVGYPNKLVSMAHDYQGGPVEGGTYPALIWHDFMTAALQTYTDRTNAERAKHGLPPQTDTTATTPADTSASGPSTGGGTTGGSGTTGTGGTGGGTTGGGTGAGGGTAGGGTAGGGTQGTGGGGGGTAGGGTQGTAGGGTQGTAGGGTQGTGGGTGGASAGGAAAPTG